MMVPFRGLADVPAAIPLARQHLVQNGVLGHPTETVYGLGSLPTADAVAAVANLKGRSEGQPFLLLVASRAMAESWGLEFGPAASVLAGTFWPGPLTLVISGAGDRLAPALRGPSGGYAVRHTAHTAMAALIGALDTPLTSTSANRPGTPPVESAEAMAELFGVDVRAGRLMILDGGTLPARPASTVVDCVGDRPKLIREGAVPWARIQRTLV
jgi:L-threonylcarbamoyladenylate synthase